MEELIHQFMIVTQGQDAPTGEVYFGAENPKGELGFISTVLRRNPAPAEDPRPIFVNLSILSHMLPGHMMADVVAILGSLDFVMENVTDELYLSENLKQEVAELLTHYPEGERSASLMVLHAIQSEAGYISKEAMQWAAGEIGIQPLNLYELVTFYPMLREEQPGKYVLKVCRTLSWRWPAAWTRTKACNKLKLDPKKHGLQTTEDKKFSIEFAECLASCGTGPVMMCNDDFYEAVDDAKTVEILGGCE